MSTKGSIDASLSLNGVEMVSSDELERAVSQVGNGPVLGMTPSDCKQLCEPTDQARQHTHSPSIDHHPRIPRQPIGGSHSLDYVVPDEDACIRKRTRISDREWKCWNGRLW